MENPYLIDLDPHEPHDPDRSRALASALADAVRALNYATNAGPGLVYPSHVYDVVGRMHHAVHGLNTTLTQLHTWISGQTQQGHTDTTDDRTPREAADEFARHMSAAAQAISQAAEHMARAQASINTLGTP